MNSAVLTVKTDKKIKKQAMEIADNLGFSLSSLINAYLRSLVKNKIVYFSGREEEPSEYLIEAINEAEKERKKGNYYSFADPQKALDFLDDVRNKRIKV